MDIRIGVPVKAEDGEAGRVERIILNPTTHEFEGIVATKGWLLPHDVVIPAARVIAGSEEGLWVRGTAEEIAALDSFSHSQYTEPPEEWIPPADQPASGFLFPASPYAVGAFTPASPARPAEHEVEDLPPGELAVHSHTPVYFREHVVGHVERVLTDGDSDTVTHVIVHRDGVLGKIVAVPFSKVERITESGVCLAVEAEELDELAAA